MHPDSAQSSKDISLSSKQKTQKTYVILLLSLVLFTHIMDFMVLMPLGPQLMRLFQISPRNFSLLVSVYAFSAGIFGLLGTFIFDRIDRKTALLISYFGFLLGTCACAMAPNYEFLLLARGLSGAFGGVLNAIAFAIVGDVFSQQERGTATGKLMASFSLASVIGVPSGLLLANAFDWHAPFIAIASFGIFIFVALIFCIPRIPPRPDLTRTFFSGITSNLKDRNAVIALATTFAMIFSQFMVIPFISPYLVSTTGFPEGHLPLVYLLGGSLTAISGPWIGRLCDRHGARKVLARTGLLFLIPVLIITRLEHTPFVITLLITTLFFILSNARMVPTMTIIASSIPPERRGSFMSLNACLQQLGSASSSFIGGWFVTQPMMGGPMLGFEKTAVLAILFGIIAYFFGQRVKMIS